MHLHAIESKRAVGLNQIMASRIRRLKALKAAQAREKYAQGARIFHSPRSRESGPTHLAKTSVASADLKDIME